MALGQGVIDLPSTHDPSRNKRAGTSPPPTVRTGQQRRPCSASSALYRLPVPQLIRDQLHALPIVASIEDRQILRVGAQVDTDCPRIHDRGPVGASREIPARAIRGLQLDLPVPSSRGAFGSRGRSRGLSSVNGFSSSRTLPERSCSIDSRRPRS